MKDVFYFFQVDKTSGDIALFSKVTPEASYLLNVSVTDEDEMETFTTVAIVVTPRKPPFDSKKFEFLIEEGSYSGHLLGEVAKNEEKSTTDKVKNFCRFYIRGTFVFCAPIDHFRHADRQTDRQ